MVSHYSGRVFLRTDCEAVVKKFRRLLHGGTVRANSVHADLWSAIQQCIRSRQGSTIITRLAAHQNEEVAPSVFAAWCFRHNGLADAWAVFANFDRPNLFWHLRSRRHTALEGITQINRVVQQVLLRISQEVVRHDTPAILELPAHVASVIPFESWFPLPPLTIPCGAVRWYGDALVRIVSSWFWQTLHDSSECLSVSSGSPTSNCMLISSLPQATRAPFIAVSGETVVSCPGCHCKAMASSSAYGGSPKSSRKCSGITGFALRWAMACLCRMCWVFTLVCWPSRGLSLVTSLAT